jgi:hypothetical protein
VNKRGKEGTTIKMMEQERKRGNHHENDGTREKREGIYLDECEHGDGLSQP